MSKAIEELSQNLATGMSRRRALWRFATGIGAVAGLGLLTRKKAKAAANPFYCFQVMAAEYQCCLSEGGHACFAAAASIYEKCISEGANNGLIVINACEIEIYPPT